MINYYKHIFKNNFKIQDEKILKIRASINNLNYIEVLYLLHSECELRDC